MQSDASEGASKEITLSDVTVGIEAGSIGQAVARRISAGKHVLVDDLPKGNADAAAERVHEQEGTAT